MKAKFVALFFIIPTFCFSQTKKGGFFNRIDDPYATYIYNNFPAGEILNNEKAINYLDFFNMKSTFATVTEYPSTTGYLLEPNLKIYPQKLTYLKRLVEKGHTIAMHTPNHTTNYYNVNIDSLSASDQLLLSNGYNIEDGIDTIVINNTDQPDTVSYFKLFPDDRYCYFGYGRIMDEDDLPDSILYYRIIPPKCVHISIYPNVAGLTRMINEQKRQFVESGLPDPIAWIHPGQEFTYSGFSLDTLIESTGYVTTKAGVDTVVYHTQKIYSSNKYPKVINGQYQSSFRINDVKYLIPSNSVIVNVGDSVITAKLTGFTGDGSIHNAKLVPYAYYNWMWQVEAETLKTVAENLHLKMSATYPYGRQYAPIGYNASVINKQYFKWAHQWGHIVLGNITAKEAIKRICKAITNHYFVATNDHQYLGNNATQEQVDSLYSFINANRDKLKVLSFIDLQDSLYNVSVNPYENILPSFDVDLNSDNIQDTWINKTNVWNRDGDVYVDGDSTYMILSTTTVSIDSLWGVEKGNNILSLYLRSSDSDSCLIRITEYKHRTNTAQYVDVVATTAKYIKNLTTNFINHLIVFNINNTTDYVKIEFGANKNNISAIKPKMSKYNRLIYN